METGTLHAAKGADGVYMFDEDELRKLKASVRGDQHGARSAAATSTPISEAPTVLAFTATRGAEPAPTGVTAPWLLAAAAEKFDGHCEDGDPENEVDRAACEPPFWAAAAAPTYSKGHPVVDPITRVITYVPAVSNASATSAPGTVGAVIAEQQQQVAELHTQLAAARAQLEAVEANAERWRLAWRHARAAGKADLISMQPRVAGEPPACVDAVWIAAGSAADALSDAQLADDAVSFSAAHAAGVAARMAWTAEADRLAREYDGDHELARARARRGRSRSRSPRW